MARDAGVETMRWFTTDACYVFHPMNAWEEGETIFADVMEYPVAPLFPNADGSMPERASARLVRWTFDLAAASDTIKREPLDDLPGEFPRFDERRAGLSYRQGWFAGRAGGEAADSTVSRMSTSRRAKGRPTASPKATFRESRSSCHGRPMRRKATGGWSRWSIAAPRTAAIWSCSTRAGSRPGRSAPPSCRDAFRSASMATGGRRKPPN